MVALVVMGIVTAGMVQVFGTTATVMSRQISSSTRLTTERFTLDSIYNELHKGSIASLEILMSNDPTLTDANSNDNFIFLQSDGRAVLRVWSDDASGGVHAGNAVRFEFFVPTGKTPNPNVYHVTVTGGATVQDGSSWENAGSSLAHAVDEVTGTGGWTDVTNMGKEIWVQAGTYTSDTSLLNLRITDTTDNVTGKKIRLYGGFVGDETTSDDRDERKFADNETILTTTSAVSIAFGLTVILEPVIWCTGYNSGGPDTHVAPEDLRIDGFTITNANGRGMFNHRASPVITNCTFSGDKTTQKGGGMYNDTESFPTITNCIFFENYAEYGGGMYNTDSSPKVINCTFSQNTATKGAEYYSNASFTVMNTIFENGATSAVYQDSGTFNYQNIVVSSIGGAGVFSGDVSFDSVGLTAEESSLTRTNGDTVPFTRYYKIEETGNATDTGVWSHDFGGGGIILAPDTDQRGFVRYDSRDGGTYGETASVDIGSYEYHPPTP